MEKPVALEVRNLIKYFHEPETFQVLKGVSMVVTKGEFLSIVGKSGSGSQHSFMCSQPWILTMKARC